MKSHQNRNWVLPGILAISLTGCAQTHMIDTSPARGNPQIVASKVTVEVSDLDGAGSAIGGRVERRDIAGSVVMSLSEYRELKGAIDRMAEDKATTDERETIRQVYVSACRADTVCDTIARKQVEKLLKH